MAEMVMVVTVFLNQTQILQRLYKPVLAILTKGAV